MACSRSLLHRFSSPPIAIAAICCYFLVACFSLAGRAYALDPSKRLTQYIHTSWRTQDGSLPAGMFSITQTSDGFLWFLPLSRRELYRFDGVRFLSWHLPTESGSTDAILKVFGDHAGGLWVLRDRGIVRLKGGSVISSFELTGLQSAQNVSEAPDGSLWVVRGSNSISDAPLCHLGNHGAKCFGKADGVPIAPVNSLLADGNGGFWIGGETALVHWQDGVSQVYPIEALKSNAGQAGIVAMAHGADGSFWVGIEAEGPGLGLGRLRGGTVKPFVTPTFDGSKIMVLSIIVDRDRNLWVGTGKGLFRISGNEVDHYGPAEGLSGDAVFALFEDREGMIWAATPNGIDSFRDPRVTTFSASEGLQRDGAVGILASRDGTVWVANNESLDRIENGSISSIRPRTGLPGHQVSSLLEDRAGNLWVGVDDGLYLFKDGHFRRLPEPPNRPLGLVVGIAEDVDGNIWAECVGNPRKLVRIRDFQVREEFPASQIPPGRSVAADPRGGIWISTLKGEIALLHDGVLKTFPLNAQVDPISRPIIARPDGSVLTGSVDGLLGWRNGKVRRLTTRNGLPCNFVISLIEDREKRWWLYTECGVVVLTDSDLERWWANPEAIVQTRIYDALDGARPARTSFNSAAVSPDGRIWFANGNVVQMLDPSKLSRQVLPAVTYVETVIVDRKEFAPTDKINFGPRPRELQIDYTSPTFLIPEKVKFRYRLQGYEHDWHDAGTRRQAFYTELPPGKYSFRVMAANSDGVWNESAARLDFSIAPAYYQTNWFRALCAMILLALLWAAYQFRARQLQQHFEMALDARVGERTRIARELHDTLLQSFHGLLLRFQTVSQLLPARPAEAKEKLQTAIQLAAEAITEGRDAVQGLRDSTVQANDLALAISTFGEELATEPFDERPTFNVAVEGESRDLHPIIRDEIYKIAAEALRNSYRHAQAGRIEVEIRYDNEQFRLRVRDDGQGIDPVVLQGQTPERHFGLHGLRERATLIGGKLEVWSEVDTGTEVELRIPASIVYASAGKRSWFARKFATKA